MWVRVRHRTQMMTRMGMWHRSRSNDADYKDMTKCDLLNLCNKRRTKDKFDIVLRCWKMDPRMTVTRHCGSNQAYVFACVLTPEFEDIMTYVRKCLQMLWDTDRDTIRVVCTCDHGIHQSVAVSTILQAVYANMGFNSKGPFHLSKAAWHKYVCDRCKDCKPNDRKDELFEDFASQFKNNPVHIGAEG